MAFYSPTGDVCGPACGYCGRCTSGIRRAIYATCADCGEAFVLDHFEPGAICNDCCDKRDDWATTQELLLQEKKS